MQAVAELISEQVAAWALWALDPLVPEQVAEQVGTPKQHAQCALGVRSVESFSKRRVSCRFYYFYINQMTNKGQPQLTLAKASEHYAKQINRKYRGGGHHFKAAHVKKLLSGGSPFDEAFSNRFDQRRGRSPVRYAKLDGQDLHEFAFGVYKNNPAFRANPPPTKFKDPVLKRQLTVDQARELLEKIEVFLRNS